MPTDTCYRDKDLNCSNPYTCNISSVAYYRSGFGGPVPSLSFVIVATLVHKQIISVKLVNTFIIVSSIMSAQIPSVVLVALQLRNLQEFTSMMIILLR